MVFGDCVAFRARRDLTHALARAEADLSVLRCIPVLFSQLRAHKEEFEAFAKVLEERKLLTRSQCIEVVRGLGVHVSDQPKHSPLLPPDEGEKLRRLDAELDQLWKPSRR
jgi:hypothetical protein